MAKLKKWKYREKRLTKLKRGYHDKLQDLAGVENPSAIWRTQPVEQLPDAVTPFADQPIVETLLDFDDDGRLAKQPELEGGWKAYAGNISIGPSLHDPAQKEVMVDTELRRDNMTVRYRLSKAQLERAGFDPDNLGASRFAFQMEPSTTWREALLNIEEQEQRVKEEKGRPKRTLQVLDFRLELLENVLYRFEAFGSVEPMTEKEAREAAHSADEDDNTPDKWEQNAARMYAYITQYEPPKPWGDLDSLKELEERIKEEGPLDSFSHDHTWKILRKKTDYASTTGIEGLVKALEDWAPDFEEEYGYPKAVRAAKPFDWPMQKDS